MVNRAIPETTEVTVAAITERTKRRAAEAAAAAFDPEAQVDFSRSTTAIESAVPSTLVLGLTTAVTSANLIIATTTLEDRVNTLAGLINNVVYVLQNHGLSS